MGDQAVTLLTACAQPRGTSACSSIAIGLNTPSLVNSCRTNDSQFKPQAAASCANFSPQRQKTSKTVAKCNTQESSGYQHPFYYSSCGCHNAPEPALEVLTFSHWVSTSRCTNNMSPLLTPYLQRKGRTANHRPMVAPALMCDNSSKDQHAVPTYP